VKVFCKAGGPVPGQSPLLHTKDGLLLISHEAKIRPIGDSKFDGKAASVACKELYKNPNVVSWEAGQDCGTSEDTEYWISDVQCDDSSLRISDCAHTDWNKATTSGKDKCVKIECKGQKDPDNDKENAKPVPVHDSLTAVLSIKYKGETRAFCDDAFDDDTAQVVCSQLYENPAFLRYNLGQTCT
jgi:hypothetical protein